MTVSQLGAEALQLAYDAGLDFHDPAECAWALTRDAMRTIEALPGDGPRGYPSASAMPDQVRSHWDLFAVERERITDRVVVQTTTRFTPSPRQITRAEETLALWHPQNFRGQSHHVDRMVKALLVYAGGVPLRRVSRVAGLKSDTIAKARRRFCLTVGRQILPHLENVAKSA